MKVLQQLEESQKRKLARYIAEDLTIKQRKYISNKLTKADFGEANLDRVKQIFMSTSIFQIRADLDGFLILA